MIKRLRHKSFKELRARAAQGAHMVMERLDLSRRARLPESIHFITNTERVSDRDLTGDRLRDVTKPGHHFYPSVNQFDAVIAVIRSRFPEEEFRIIEAADRICAGRFDLMGYKDLSFGGPTPDWHLDPVSGKTSPLVHWSRIVEVDATATGDKKVIWELNRHQFFVVLGQAYVLTRDERYAECFSRLITSWMDLNPPKIGVNWLSSLEIAFRSISWIWAFHLFRSSSSFTPELLARMTRFLCTSARHIETYLSTYFSPNTHLTGEALGLYLLGSFLPEIPDASRWKSLGYKVLIDSLEFQVRPDGTYCEQASHYLRYTTDFYATLFLMRSLEGSSEDTVLTTKLNQLYDCLLHVTMPNGQSPNFGDEDGGRLSLLDGSSVTDLRPALVVGAVLLEREDLKHAAREAGPDLLWMLGTRGLDAFDAIAPIEPKETTRSFPDGGIFCARSDWSSDADSILIDCGPHGFLNGGHAHADALSFILCVGGLPVFIDSGTFNYTSNLSERDRFRSSQAHNALTVNGTSSSIPAGPFSWQATTDGRLIEWRNADDGAVHFQGSHDGFARFGVEYQRTIDIDFDREIRLEDHVSSTTVNLYEVHFVLSPHVSAEILEVADKVLITKAQGDALLQMTSTVSGNVVEEPNWRSEDWRISSIYGEAIASKKLVYSVKGTGSLRLCIRLTKC